MHEIVGSEKGVRVKAAVGLKLTHLNFLRSATINDLEIFARDALVHERFLQAFQHLSFASTGRPLCEGGEAAQAAQPPLYLHKLQTGGLDKQVTRLVRAEEVKPAAMTVARTVDQYLANELFEQQRVKSFSNTTIKNHEHSMPLAPVLEIEEEKHDGPPPADWYPLELARSRRSTEPLHLSKRGKKNRFGQGYIEVNARHTHTDSSEGSRSQRRNRSSRIHARARSHSEKVSSESAGDAESEPPARPLPD